MTVYLLLNHLFNFMAPAALLAVLLVLLSRLFFGFFRSKSPFAHAWLAQDALERGGWRVRSDGGELTLQAGNRP